MVRFKNRYFVIEIKPENVPENVPFELKRLSLHEAILKQVEKLHGDYGVGCVINGFVAKYCNPYTRIALMRCRHGAHRFLATSIPLVKSLEGVRVTIQIIYLGATISKCYKFVRRHQLRSVERMWFKMKTDKDRELMKESVMDLSEMEIITKYERHMQAT